LAALPGAEWVLPFMCARGLVGKVDEAARRLGRAGLHAGTDLRELWKGYVSLTDTSARQAFIETVRTVVDVGGQRVTATNRLYLAAALPTLILWGEQDPMIPVAHAHAAHAAIPGSRLAVFPGAGHFPHLDCPERFVQALVDFMQSTVPAQLDPIKMGDATRTASERAVPDRSPPLGS
jgi:pimeloyl-ACP methyl ester carboxylesterase